MKVREKVQNFEFFESKTGLVLAEGPWSRPGAPGAGRVGRPTGGRAARTGQGGRPTPRSCPGGPAGVPWTPAIAPDPPLSPPAPAPSLAARDCPSGKARAGKMVRAARARAAV